MLSRTGNTNRRCGCGFLCALIFVLIFLSGAWSRAAEESAFPESLSSMDPQKAGQLLAEKLRATPPSEATALKGTLRIRRGGKTGSVPFQFEAKPGSASWQASYETKGVGETPAEKLVIVYRPNAANEYFFAKSAKAGEPPGSPVALTNSQAAASFAGSDFWLSDLGLEFAHWPAQRYAFGEMREHRYCFVLDSVSPEAAGKGYGRVRSWIDKESGGLLLADAYDKAGNKLKEFRVSKLKKIKGQWQLQEMEISNLQTNSRTTLKFDYEDK